MFKCEFNIDIEDYDDFEKIIDAKDTICGCCTRDTYCADCVVKQIADATYDLAIRKEIIEDECM